MLVGDVFLGSAAAFGTYSVLRELTKEKKDDLALKLSEYLSKPVKVKLLRKKKKKLVYTKPAVKTSAELQRLANELNEF